MTVCTGMERDMGWWVDVEVSYAVPESVMDDGGVAGGERRK